MRGGAMVGRGARNERETCRAVHSDDCSRLYVWPAVGELSPGRPAPVSMSSTLERPMMPLSGVRSSWLINAMNCSFCSTSWRNSWMTRMLQRWGPQACERQSSGAGVSGGRAANCEGGPQTSAAGRHSHDPLGPRPLTLDQGAHERPSLTHRHAHCQRAAALQARCTPCLAGAAGVRPVGRGAQRRPPVGLLYHAHGSHTAVLYGHEVGVEQGGGEEDLAQRVGQAPQHLLCEHVHPLQL